MDKVVDVAIIGGGAVGCSIAYHAASRGARVVLFEAQEIGSGSSGALAGMLSGQGEAEKPGPLRDLLVQGREYHKTFAQELYETTELDPGYVSDGALRTATDEASKEKLLMEHSWHEEGDLPSEWLSGDEARELEPALSPEVSAGLYLPEDGQVNPRPLVQALAQGATLKGRERRSRRPLGSPGSSRRGNGLAVSTRPRERRSRPTSWCSLLEPSAACSPNNWACNCRCTR